MISSIALCMALVMGCKQNQQVDATLPEPKMETKADFNADSAFNLVKKQCDMGPRTPRSPGHSRCEQFIINKLKSYGADTVVSQKGYVKAFTGESLPLHNILGRFNAKAPRRILIFAHYDTRPWADHEDDESLHSTPIPGANDGGSGVAVLLEMARHINELNPSIGVDLLFTDVEDYGNSDGFEDQSYTWGLGAQYFANHLPYSRDSLPIYGIGVDMVGGKNATFRKGYYSDQYAPTINNKVWNIAEQSGYKDRFVDQRGGGIVDDFLFINEGGIPSINIIEAHNPETGSFPATWHTLKDDINHIDPQSLKAVGQTLLNLISVEKL